MKISKIHLCTLFFLPPWFWKISVDPRFCWVQKSSPPPVPLPPSQRGGGHYVTSSGKVREKVPGPWKFRRYSVMYPEFFLGRPVHTLNPQRCHNGWPWSKKISKFVSKDIPKMHSQALSVLKFLSKTFFKLLKLTL